MPNALEATRYPLTRFSWDWLTINSLYRSHWIVKRIINTIPADMMKNGYKIISQIPPDAIDKISRVERKTCTTARIMEGLQLGRLYGGAGALILLRGQEDELDQPLRLDEVMPGDYKGLLVLDRWTGISPENELIGDMDDADFGMPDFYDITCDLYPKGIRVHHSRILRFIGQPLPYYEKQAENYWGASELEHVIDELKKRDNVSWNIAMLTFMANLRVMKMEGMSQLLAAGSEQAQRDLYNTIQGMNAMMNNNSIQILGENDSFETHQYTFGGIADTYDRFMMDVAGAAETPVTKLFGRSPAGMNATGESDMQNYYDTIEEKQESVLRPVYDKLLPIMAMSALGAVPDDLDFEFNAVRRPDEDEMSDLASKNTDSVTKAFQAGLISQRTALKELRSQSEITGMWTNITDEDIEKADDTIQDPNEGMEDMSDMFGGGGQEEKNGPSATENAPRSGENPGRDKLPMREEKQPSDRFRAMKGKEPEPKRTTDAPPYKGQPRESDGRFGKKPGSNTTKEKKVKVDYADLRRYNQALRGTKTVDGIEITRVSVHAVERIIGRGIYPKRVKEVISSADTKISPGNTQETVCYDYNNKRVVVDKTNGTIVSIMHRRQRNG